MSAILYPEQRDRVSVAGYELPGICIIKGAKRAYDWDAKKPKGASGATTTYQGEPPQAFSVEVQLWTQEHFDSWDVAIELLKRAQNLDVPTAVDVDAIELAHLDIRECVVTEIHAREHQGAGLWLAKVAFLEFRKPVAKGGTPTGAGKSGSGGTDTGGGTNDPNADALAGLGDPVSDPREEQLEQLWDEVKNG